MRVLVTLCLCIDILTIGVLLFLELVSRGDPKALRVGLGSFGIPLLLLTGTAGILSSIAMILSIAQKKLPGHIIAIFLASVILIAFVVFRYDLI